jgi:hypothetical protein
LTPTFYGWTLVIGEVLDGSMPMDGLSILLLLLGAIAVSSLVIRLLVGPSIGIVTSLIWGAYVVFATSAIVVLAEDGLRLGEALILCAVGLIAIGVFGGPERPASRR